MKFIRLKTLYISALALLFFIMILLTYIAFSTYHTMNSNEENAIVKIENQGNVIVDVLLVSLNIILNDRGFSARETTPHNVVSVLIEDLIKEIRERRIIGYFCVVSEKGLINYHSNPDFNMDIRAMQAEMRDKKATIGKFRKLDNGMSVYEIARRIPSFFVTPVSDKKTAVSYDYILLGMEMTEYETARKADLNHAAIMITILLTLGCGALFFMFIIRNYYLVNSELSESRDYIHSVVENMANGLISVNHAGEIVACNKPAEKLLGEGKIRGQNIEDVLGCSIPMSETGIMETLKGGITIRNREIEYHNNDDERKTILLNSTPLTGLPEVVTGAVIILNDLSEIKKLEDTVRRTENFAMIGKMAAVVAHEIRNPLSSIRGFATFFGKTLPKEEKSSEYAEIMVGEVDRINRVITELLQYSKQEVPDLKATDIYDLVDRTLLLIEGDIQADQVTIENEVSQQMPAVDIDPDKMKQVLLNLLLNAIQMGAGNLTISIGAEIRDENDLHLWVEDNGPGIDVEDKQTVFDPFFSLRELGTGLGLSIVQKIIETHEGSITFESPITVDSKGTRFLMTLPVKRINGIKGS